MQRFWSYNIKKTIIFLQPMSHFQLFRLLLMLKNEVVKEIVDAVTGGK